MRWSAGRPRPAFPFAPEPPLAYPLSVKLSVIGKASVERLVWGLGLALARPAPRRQLGVLDECAVRQASCSRQHCRVILSVVIIAFNEEANIGRTLASVHRSCGRQRRDHRRRLRLDRPHRRDRANPSARKSSSKQWKRLRRAEEFGASRRSAGRLDSRV